MEKNKNCKLHLKKTRNKIDVETKNSLKITADNNELNNLDFVLREMEKALKACKGTSPGPDEINYDTGYWSISSPKFGSSPVYSIPVTLPE